MLECKGGRRGVDGDCVRRGKQVERRRGAGSGRGEEVGGGEEEEEKM